MATPANPAHLEPSKLGTKEYWDSLYTNELSNHAADPSDIGTVWFDDSDAEAKIVEFLSDESLFPPEELPRDTTSLLDLGSGNGSLLFALRDEGWNGPALGVDYSSQSVELARNVAASRRENTEDEDEAAVDAEHVRFDEWDVLAGPLPNILSGAQSHGFDIVLDKGTFDAISLSEETDTRGRRLCEGYCERALQLVRPGGLFLITSCNWTEAELRNWFEGRRQDEGGRFEVLGRVEYRSFSFGGMKGQTISTLCFRKI